MNEGFVVTWLSMSVAKQGNKPEENEDVARPGVAYRRYVRKREFRCAMADGASQSSFSRLWARELTLEVQRRTLSDSGLGDAISLAAKRWQEEVQSRPLAWNLEIKVQQGAHATLLAAKLSRYVQDEEVKRGLTVLAVGDSCLFQFRQDELVWAFPVEKSSSFGNYPALLCSIPAKNERVLGSVRLEVREWESGDEFILATDAVAQWLLREIEAGCVPVEAVRRVAMAERAGEGAFDAWIQGQRSSGAMENDDSTLVWLQVREIE